MKPTKGLHKDLRPEEQPPGTYFFGKNGLQFDRMGSITNEPGFKKLMQGFTPNGYKINGILETDTTKVIVFSTNDTNSAVQLVDLDSQSVEYMFNDTAVSYLLGFKKDNYITGEVQRNYKGEIVCAFTDKNTFPKYLNFSDPETSTLNSWNLFPQFEEPTITKTVLPGGFIDVGTHHISLRYYKTDGTRTAFTKVSSGVVITTDDGTDVADKAIEIKIADQDLSYSYMEIAIISKIKGVTSAQLMSKIPVTGGTYTVTYTGDNTTTDITVEEILTPQVNYDRVGSITQLNDSIYLGKLHNDLELLDLQPYANLVRMKWVSELMDMENIPEDHKSGQKKSMKHGEVYAIYIRYRANGRYSPWYHIPGEDMPAAMLAVSSVGTTGGVNAPIFKVEDTVTAIDTVTKVGITGPYQNDTELYPSTDEFNSTSLGGRDLRGQKVLHHKMPSVKLCKEALYPNEAEYGAKKLDVLGLQAENITIPTKYQGIIDGYEIGYAKRTIQNMTIYGQGLLLYGNQKTGASDFHSNGHNWEVTGHPLSQDNLRFHALDVLLNKPAIKPSHIASQLKLTVNTNTLYVPWSYPTGSSSSLGKGPSVHKSDVFQDGTATVLGTNNNVNGLNEPRYVKVNSKVDDYNNKYMESVLEGKLTGAPMTVTAPIDIVPLTLYTATVPVETFLTELSDIKQDVYSSFYAQELVSAGDVIDINSTKTVWGGDIFISIYTFHTYGIMDSNWEMVYDSGGKYAVPADRTRRIVHRFICETVSNHYARYETISDPYTKWYDNNTLDQSNGQDGNAYPLEYSSKLDPNQIQIVKGAEGINDFVIPHIYSPYRDYLTDFPYRVHRGGKLDRQNAQRSWRTFLALDFYECQKDKGFIVNIEGMEDRLLIHMENALFATRDKAKLESGLLGVTIGSGDIFELEPQEVQSSKLGYAGTQHDLACIRTPIGYIFPDAKQGELFLYSGGKLKKLNPGLNNFLREYLPTKGINTFTGNGITMGWDHEYKRILSTVKRIIPTSSVLSDPNSAIVLNDKSQIPSLSVGDIVFLNGKYVRYLGLNPGGADVACNPIPTAACPPVTNLQLIATDSPNTLTATWTAPAGGGTPTYFYELVHVSSNIIISSGFTTSTTFATTSFNTNALYMFRVRVVCNPGHESVWAIDYASLLVITDPEPPDPPEPGVGSMWIISRQDNIANGPVYDSTSMKITIGSQAPTYVFLNGGLFPMAGLASLNIPLPLPTVATVVMEIDDLFPNLGSLPATPSSWPNWPGTFIAPTLTTIGVSFPYSVKATYTNVPINSLSLPFFQLVY